MRRGTFITPALAVALVLVMISALTATSFAVVSEDQGTMNDQAMDAEMFAIAQAAKDATFTVTYDAPSGELRAEMTVDIRVDADNMDNAFWITAADYTGLTDCAVARAPTTVLIKGTEQTAQITSEKFVAAEGTDTKTVGLATNDAYLGIYRVEEVELTVAGEFARANINGAKSANITWAIASDEFVATAPDAGVEINYVILAANDADVAYIYRIGLGRTFAEEFVATTTYTDLPVSNVRTFRTIKRVSVAENINRVGIDMPDLVAGYPNWFGASALNNVLRV